MNHIGEVVVATNGQKMTLIAYRRYKDIDVQFEDGTIVNNKSYYHFKKGLIANPNCKVGKRNKLCRGYKIGDVIFDVTGLACSLIAITDETITVKHNNNTRILSKSSINTFQFYSSRYLSSSRVGSYVTSKDGYTALIKDYTTNYYLLYFEEDGSEFLERVSKVNNGNFFKNTRFGRVGQKYKRTDNTYWTVLEVLNINSYKVSGTDGISLVTRKELMTGKKEEKTYKYEYNGSYFKDLPSLLSSLNRIDELNRVRGIIARYPYLSISEVLNRSENVHGKKRIIYNGIEYDSLRSFCNSFNLSATTLSTYIERYGNIEDAVKYCLEYKNTKTIKDLCIVNNVDFRNFIQFRHRKRTELKGLSTLEQLQLYMDREISFSQVCRAYGLNSDNVWNFYRKYRDLVSRDTCINLYRMKEKFEFGNVTDSGNFIYANDFYFTCKCRTCGKKDILSTAQMLEHTC